MSCKTCGAPVYPPGVSYTGVACFYGGNHPNYQSPTSNTELTIAITSLAQAITELAQRLPQTKKPTPRKGER